MEKREKLKKINLILRKQLGVIKPSAEELRILNELADALIIKLNKCLKGKAEAFIGGSLAKGTLIKKERYDIDIFVRFNYKYKSKGKEMSNELEKAVKFLDIRFQRIHGSRDYLNLLLYNKKLKKKILFEIIPTLCIKKPIDAENITDLSFFHILYVKRHTDKKIADEIRLAKSFCFSQGCYGAESHIQGFSGYALELLVIYFKTFANLIKNASTWSIKDKVVIDPKRFYKNKSNVLENLNESKLISPIILIDPTFKERNVCASVSEITFQKFLNACKKFLSKPSLEFFELKKINIAEYKKIAKNKKAKFSILSVYVKENVESIAASKLFKFFNFLRVVLKKNNFEIIKSEWEFFPKNKAKFYFIYKSASRIIVQGPPIEMMEHAKKFRKKYKQIFIKNKRLYAYAKPITDIKDLSKTISKEIKAKGISLSIS